jgi:flagellar protein FliO/FliZ
MAQEQEDNLDTSMRRPAEESLLILDTGEEEQAGESEEVQGGPLVSSWDFLRMVLILAAVVGVIYLIFWMLKRGLRRQLPQNNLIRLLGTRNLSGNRALHLVEMGKQVFLVGSAEGSISLISEIRDQETLDSIALERSQMDNRAPQGFAQFFQSILKSGKQKGSSVGETIDFMKQQRQRLEKL